MSMKAKARFFSRRALQNREVRSIKMSALATARYGAGLQQLRALRRYNACLDWEAAHGRSKRAKTPFV